MIKRPEHLHLSKIIEITEVGEHDTYDFTIPGTHCFLGNGILIHNSGFLEEIADQVILLHWPWHYDNNRSQDELLLNVAKNRDGLTGRMKMFFVPSQYSIQNIHNEESINFSSSLDEGL